VTPEPADRPPSREDARQVTPEPADRQRRPDRDPPPGVPPPPADRGGRRGDARVGPTTGTAREPVLDALRGGALLGILLVNVHLLRGPDIWRIIAGETVPPTGTADRLVAALTGWLVAGKFVSSFAILFGVGAGLIASRVWATGRSPRPLLARRYGWLVLLGVAHMVLLFPGDILFLYGLAGLLLLLPLAARPATLLVWAAALVGVVTALASLLAVGGAALAGASAMTGSSGAGAPPAGSFAAFVADRADQAVEAFATGGYLDVVTANAWQALFVQSSQLLTLPWILALFLVGHLVGRGGWVADLPARRPALRRIASVGVGAGLLLNLPLLASGPLGSDGPFAGAVATRPLLALAVTVAQFVGAPVLAAGYLAAASLLFLRVGAPRPLAAVGRMALTGYLLQSLLALLAFAGLGLYGRTSAAGSLLVVAAIWGVLLVGCPLWLRAFRFGPAEWLWRTLTYGRAQPFRQQRTTSVSG
jgi:uncharacterized protein